MFRPLSIAAGAVLAGLPLAAQTPLSVAEPPTAATVATAPLLEPADRVVPIHRARGNGRSDAEALWAGGPGYGVSFGRTVRFWPGGTETAEQPLAPWEWRTESVRVGDVALIAEGEPELRWTERRFELDHGGVVEAYDVRTDGIEQTFTVTRRPERRGDLVVRGAVRHTGHGCLEAGPRHADLAFRDSDGREIVRYGKAWAIDADGAKVEMTSRHRAGTIELRLPAARVAAARFPLVVDPLISNRVVGSTSRIVVLGQARDDVANQLMVVGRSDEQDFAFLCNDDYSSPRLIHWSFDATTRVKDVAFVGGTARRWLIASSQATFAPARLRLYFHASGARGFRSGVERDHVPPGGSPVNSLKVGGSLSYAPNNVGIVVYSTVESRQLRGKAVLVDVPSRTMRAPVHLGRAWSLDVNPVSSGRNDPWLVGIGDQDAAGNLLPFRVVKVWPNGAVSRSHAVPTDLGQHKLSAVKSAGMDGSWVITYRRGLHGLGTTWRRLDWHGNGTPVFRAENWRRIGSVRGLAFDSTTRSHWCMTRQTVIGTRWYTVIERIGATAHAVELAYAPSNRIGNGGQVSYDDDARRFCASFAGPGGEWRGVVLAHDSRVRVSHYGSACGGTISTPDLPYAGTDRFRVRLRGAAPNVTATLFISRRPASTPIAGCRLLVDLGSTSWIASRAVRTSSSGNAELRHVFFDRPLFLGSVYFQWLYPSPTGLRLSRGMCADVYP